MCKFYWGSWFNYIVFLGHFTNHFCWFWLKIIQWWKFIWLSNTSFKSVYYHTNTSVNVWERQIKDRWCRLWPNNAAYKSIKSMSIIKKQKHIFHTLLCWKRPLQINFNLLQVIISWFNLIIINVLIIFLIKNVLIIFTSILSISFFYIFLIGMLAPFSL